LAGYSRPRDRTDPHVLVTWVKKISGAGVEPRVAGGICFIIRTSRMGSVVLLLPSALAIQSCSPSAQDGWGFGCERKRPRCGRRGTFRMATPPKGRRRTDRVTISTVGARRTSFCSSPPLPASRGLVYRIPSWLSRARRKLIAVAGPSSIRSVQRSSDALQHPPPWHGQTWADGPWRQAAGFVIRCFH
jgi:hypothetical protein